jgi:hypothetical protein
LSIESTYLKVLLQATSMLSYSWYKLVLILYSFVYIAPGSIILLLPVDLEPITKICYPYPIKLNKCL